MAWPYQFLDLDDAAKHARREALNRHGLIAHVSVLVLLGAVLAYRAVAVLAGKVLLKSRGSGGNYDAVPGSPAAKHRRLGGIPGSRAVMVAARRAAWWLGDDVVVLGSCWGRRDSLVFGLLWTAWLLFLCVHGTGKDYLHLTKRFGIVAVSQLPVQYALALKKLSPVGRVLRSSHEEVNRWHRALGRAVYLLLCLHTAFYLNYFVQNGIFARRMTDLVPLLGAAAFAGLSALSATAVAAVRRHSYRVFFVVHLLVALALPVFVIFHHPRNTTLYLAEAMALFAVDLVLRKRKTFAAAASLAPVPAPGPADLVKIVIPVQQPQTLEEFRRAPGAHVYLSVPSVSRPSSNLIFDFLYNPFTVAAVGDDAAAGSSLTLVARRRDGPLTRHLARLAEDVADADAPATMRLEVEGPYGCASRIADALTGNQFDRILLVAGGVGASFVIPLYRHILAENPSDARVRVVWAVRRASDATWAAEGARRSGGDSIADDHRVQLFVTANEDGEDVDDDVGRGDGDIEMRRMLDSKNLRPDLGKVVDEVFRRGAEERVAVLVCGPESMARELRGHVGAWVARGRTVFWHSEGFGW